MADDVEPKLHVSLALNWDHGNVYDAKVSVTILDTNYVQGDLNEGLPPEMAGLPEMEYLTFNFTHKGGICGHIVQIVSKTMQIPFTAAKPNVTAFVVVNGKVVGQDTKPFPKGK